MRPFPLISHSKSSRIILPAAHPASLQVLSRSGVGLGLVGEVEVAPAARVSRKDEVPIEPIRVVLAAVSGDISGKGKGSAESGEDWLATVDSRADSEIYLKFWKWNAGSVPATGNATTTTIASNLCTLNTRIDHPHGNHRVSSVAFHPAGTEMLATTGEDGLVKLWGVRRTSEEGECVARSPPPRAYPVVNCTTDMSFFKKSFGYALPRSVTGVTFL